jgi:membrane protease subunit (stomatin/prohibitin family)
MIGPKVLLWHVPHNDIYNGSLLTVESNHFAVLKSRGAVINVYETGQYPIQTGDRFLLGGVQQAFFSGQSPWQFEVLYINRSKLVVRAEGTAVTREMVEVKYAVSYYFHVESKEQCLQLIQHMPISGHWITSDEVGTYVWPVIEQDLNHFIQVTPVHQINEKIRDITQLVGQQVQTVLSLYGITLDDVRVVTQPVLNRITERISSMQLGLSLLDAYRFELAGILASRGVVSAPNAAIGEPYVIGGVQQTAPVGPEIGEDGRTTAPAGRNEARHD